MTIHVNSILTKIQNVLENEATLSGSNIDVGMPLNLDQGRLPWIGLNPGGLTATGMQIAAGQAQGWDASVDINVFHQAYSELSSGDTMLNLMITQQKIITSVSSNSRLDDIVLKLNSITSEIFETDVVKEHFLTNLITLNYDVRGS